MDTSPMVHLVSVHDSFHARVICARLGSDGIVTQLRGAVDGPYPTMGEVLIYVRDGDLAVARDLLLADEVESAFEEVESASDEMADGPAGTALVAPWMVMLAIVLVASMWMTRGI